MAELADALDSGSSDHYDSCRFKSCFPHRGDSCKRISVFYPFQPGAVSEPCNELLLAAGAALTESKVRETKSFLDTVLVDPAGFRKARG